MDDGRPLYWAAPSTTIASTACRSSRLPTSQIRYDAQPATRTAPTMAARTIRPTARITLRGDESAAVTLLVLQARATPAGIVPPDPGSRRRETRPDRSAAVRAVGLELAAHRIGREPARDHGSDRPRRGRSGRRCRGAGRRPARPGRRGRRATAAQQRRTRGQVPVDGRRSTWRLDRDGDAEDRRGDLVPDQVAQLAVELVRLAAELVERVLLGVSAQADAAPHVVDLGQVLDPQRVDRAEEDHQLDEL